MIVQEQDPDVVRWGLHLLDVCSLSNDGSHSTITRYDKDSGEVGYVREGYQEPVRHSGYATEGYLEPVNSDYATDGYPEAVNSGYPTEGYRESLNTDYGRECYQLPVHNESLRQSYPEQMPAYTENDAVIARALQEEEYSRITTAQPYGASPSGHDAILTQNWLGPIGNPDGSGVENDKSSVNDPSAHTTELDASSKFSALHVKDYSRKEESEDPFKTNKEGSDELEIKCSSFGSDEKSLDPGYLHLIEITDDSILDGEVGKRLNQMVPVPHVPKINGEIPSADEEISDHQRLLERLQLYELVENKVQGDGNCQFRAISDQLYRTHDHHKFVREQLVNQLKSYPQKYMGYVPMGYSDYLKKMSKSGEWGDHVTLQAAADWFGVKIFVITSFKDTCYIEIIPQEAKSKRVIFLSFWAEVHYNSIYPAEELPFLETKKKKWWMLGS